VLSSFLLFQGYLGWIVSLVLLVVKAYAFVNSLLHSPEEYRAASKWTKPGWNVLLGVGLLLQLMPVLDFSLLLDLALIIAAFVYLADVRPAMKALYRRR
jgi:hypothetical protein